MQKHHRNTQKKEKRRIAPAQNKPEQFSHSIFITGKKSTGF